MSDMLAVLLGGGGGMASQAMAALAGGKLEAKSGQAPLADPFLEVLSSRLNAMQGTGDPSAPAAVHPVDVLAETAPVLEDKDMAEALLQPLEPALPNTLGPSTEAVPPEVQAALAAPLLQGQNPAVSQDGQKALGDGPGMVLAPELPGVKDVEGIPLERSLQLAPALQMEAKAKAGMAEAAADGQLLPPGRERPDLPLKQSRVEGGNVLPVPQAASMSVAQNLAAQFQSAPAESSLGVSLQAGQAMFPGAAHGMGIMGDVHGRPIQGAMHLAIDVPLRNPLFPQELGDRIVWLTARQGQVAEIALNPPHLGPLEVKLSLVGGEAGAQFFSPHPQVREAIEAALPRLREMMAEAGLNLGQTQVREESLSRQEARSPGDAQREAAGSEEGLRAGQVEGLGTRRIGLGLVDVFV